MVIEGEARSLKGEPDEKYASVVSIDAGTKRSTPRPMKNCNIREGFDIIIDSGTSK